MQIAGKCSSPSKYMGMDIGNLPTSAMCTEEEIRRQEEADRRRKEEKRRRQEEERSQREEEMRKQEEQRRQDEEERQQREEEIRRQEEEKRQQEEILRQEEAKRLREEELSRQEEQRRQDEEEIRRQEEERRQSQEEIIRNETMTTTTSAPFTSTIEPKISSNFETTMESNNSNISGTTEAPVATDPSTTVTIADATESSEGVMEGGEDNSDRNDEREHNNVVMENLNATQSKENSEEVDETEKVKPSNFTETQDSEKQDNDDPSIKMSEMDIKEIEKMITEIKGGKLKNAQTTNKNKDASVDNFNPDQENSISGGASDHDVDTGSGTQGDDSAQTDKVKSDAMGSQKSSKAHWGKEPWVITLIVIICVLLLVGSIVGIIKAKGHLYRNNYNFNFSREYIISPEIETLY